MAFSFASGNNGYNFDKDKSANVWPACGTWPYTLTVTANAKNGSLIDYGNTGTRCVDIVAPGDWIYNLSPNNQYVNRGGTSMAAPQVAAALGLALLQNRQLSNQASVSLVKNTVQKDGKYTTVRTGGKLDLLNVVKSAKSASRLSIDPSDLGRSHPHDEPPSHLDLGDELIFRPGDTAIIPLFIERELEGVRAEGETPKQERERETPEEGDSLTVTTPLKLKLDLAVQPITDELQGASARKLSVAGTLHYTHQIPCS